MRRRPALRRYDREIDQSTDLASLAKVRLLKDTELVDRLRCAVHFDFIAVIGLDVEGYRLENFTSINSTLPPAFVETYTAERLYMTDPLIARVRETGDVVQDSDIGGITSTRLRYLLRALRVNNRVLFPIGPTSNIFGAVMLAREKVFTADEIYFGSVVAEATHQAVTGPIMEKFGASALKLTKGELLCLQHAYFGLTSDQISQRTGFQRETVNAYVKTATKKLGATNRTRAIIEALQRGLLQAG